MRYPTHYPISVMDSLFLISLVDSRISEYEVLKNKSPRYFFGAGLQSCLDNCYSLKDKLFDIYLSYEEQKELIEK